MVKVISFHITFIM